MSVTRTTSGEALSNVHELPAHIRALINREDERALARSVLLDEGVRLLTLLGPPGIGKTRLAVAIAEDVAPAFPDGMWFIDLSQIHDAAAVPSAVLDVLQPREFHSVHGMERLEHRLEDRRLLLLLDNFEHLHDAAVLMGELLASHPGLSVVATSRQPLHLRWEHVMTVPPLAVSPDPRDQPFEVLAALPSVQLFVQRAEARRLDFVLTPDNICDIATICTQVEGVPLAIELAAGWVNLLPPSSILEYLRQHLDFLHSTARDVPARQQSLTAALDWSFTLLSPAEQALLGRMSVFAGGFTLDGAMTVMGSTEIEVLESLAGLVDKSLVQTQDNGEAETRFHLSHSVKVYAQEQLATACEAEETRERHARYFLALAEHEGRDIRQAGFFFAAAALPPPENWSLATSLSVIERERTDLIAALRWFVQAAQPDGELRLAAALAPYWWSRVHLTEGAKSLEEALDRHSGVPAALRIRALNGLALILHRQGRSAPARCRLDEALSLARSHGDPQLLGDTLINLVTVQAGVSESHHPAALALLQEAQAVFVANDDAWGVAIVQLHLAMADLIAGHAEHAEGLLTQALDTLERLEDLRSVAAAFLLLGHAAQLQGARDQVPTFVLASLRLFRATEYPQLFTAAIDLIAWMYRDDRPQQSAILAGASDTMTTRGFVRATYNRFLHAQTMERLRNRLSEHELASGLEIGRSWTPDETMSNLQLVFEGAEDSLVRFEFPAEYDSQPALTDREREVLRLMSEGLSTDEIADTIFVSSGTVKLDIRSLYRKLKVQNRAQAMAVAAERGLI